MNSSDISPVTQPWRQHYVASFTLGLPLIGSHLAQMLTNVTDVVMLGWYGVDDLAAAVLATQVYFIVFIVGCGFAFAVMPMVATAVGQGDETSVRRSVRMGAWLCIAYCCVFFVPMWFLKGFLELLGQDPELSQMAQDYMRIAEWGMLPAMLIMVLKSYLAALSRAQVVLVATVLGAVANAIANYAFIFGNWGAPEMGIRGAAVASLVTQTLACVFLFGYAAFLPTLKKYELFVRVWKPDWAALKDVLWLGTPIGMTMLAETGLFAASTFMMGWLGTIALASHGIVLQIASMMFMVPLGISNVATIRGGHALGARNYGDLYRTSIAVLVMGLSVVGAGVVLLLSVPDWLIGLFMDSDDPLYDQIILYGVPLLMVAALFQLTDSMQVILLGLLRGIKDTAVPMILAVVSYWMIGMPAGYYLGFKMGYEGVGIWLGLVVGLTVAAVTMGIRYRLRLRQLKPALSQH